MEFTEKDIVRFWDKVDRETTPNGCWDYKAGLNPKGYGLFWINKKNVAAPRASYTIENGPIPEGMYVCHTCDNPRCCNPDHLFLGTPQDNMDDMYSKGRQIHLSGEQLPQHKLTKNEVIEIRSLPKMTHMEISKMYGVSRPTISMILSRKRWSNTK